MEWEMSFNAKENILSVKTYGIFDMATHTQLIKEFLEVVRKQNCRRCLIDNGKIESENIGTLDIYSIPALFTELGFPRDLHIAEVISEKYTKDFHFLETVCHNNGYSVSAFFDVESALQWLKH